MEKRQEITYGDTVEWTYQHALNATARTPITKRGTVVGVGKVTCYVHFKGNKRKSRVLTNQLIKI